MNDQQFLDAEVRSLGLLLWVSMIAILTNYEY